MGARSRTVELTLELGRNFSSLRTTPSFVAEYHIVCLACQIVHTITSVCGLKLHERKLGYPSTRMRDIAAKVQLLYSRGQLEVDPST